MSIIVKSGISGKVPTAAQLEYGQLALNYADQKIYFKNSSNQVVTYAPSGTVPYNGPYSFVDQDTTTAPYFATATLSGSAFAPSTKIRATGGTKTSSISYGVLHNVDNTMDACIQRIDASDANNKYWLFKESGDFVSIGNVTAYSDIRLKTNLEVIPDALLKVQQLTGYTYKRLDTLVQQTGLIAQDVQKVLPEAVTQGEYLGISYGNLVGLLVEAIKEQQQQIEELRNDIKRLGTN